MAQQRVHGDSTVQASEPSHYH